MIEPAREQEVDRAEQIDLGRWKRVLAFYLGARRAGRLTRAQVRHAIEPHEAAAAVTFEAEERARAVILQRARQHLRAVRERSGRDALVRERAHRLIGDAHFDRFTTCGIVSGIAIVASGACCAVNADGKVDVEQAAFILEGIRDGLDNADLDEGAGLIQRDIERLNDLVFRYNSQAGNSA